MFPVDCTECTSRFSLPFSSLASTEELIGLLGAESNEESAGSLGREAREELARSLGRESREELTGSVGAETSEERSIKGESLCPRF